MASRPFLRVGGVEELTLTSGRIVRLHRPPGVDGPTPALLWMHGGACILGHPKTDDWECQAFSRRLGVTVAAVQYRLAPEHPYPAALEDCHAALTWLASLPSVDASRIAIGGESGGGGLAAMLAFVARDRAEVSPVFQVLRCPMLDDRAVAKTGVAHNYRMWNERSNRFAWKAYLGGADPDVAVPGRRIDVAGLPPAWIGVGTEDLFHDECVAYAQRLRGAGVQCHLEVVPGAFHIFNRVAPWTSVARAYVDNQCAALRQAFRTAGPRTASPARVARRRPRR